MTYDLARRLRAFVRFVLGRASESSTWQGIGFLATFLGVKAFGEREWTDPAALAAATALGALVSALIKIFLPDSFHKE